MRYLRSLSRIIIGIVFVFSGFVKAIDPLGSAYKFSDYFNAFNLGVFDGIALPLAIFLAVFELVLGFSLLMGYRKKIAYWLLMIFMSFFTLLTFILTIFNPVSDCGCFGDAIIMTNWQTFLKNAGLMVFVLILFFDRNESVAVRNKVFEWSAITLFSMAALVMSIWCYRHLPLIDFRPFDIGTSIPEEMVIPEGAPVDQYETKLYYRNRGTGKVETFSLQNYPKDTIKWEFKDSESKLIKKGYEPPIHDFAIIDPYHVEITTKLLHDPDYSLMMIAYDLEKANGSALQKANDWSAFEKIAGDFTFYAVTASAQQQINSVKRDYSLSYNFHSADEIMLKTIIRSDPGFLLLKNGTIIGKWGWRDFPSLFDIDDRWQDMLSNTVEPEDEELRMLKEAGVYDDINFEVVEFDQSAMKLSFSSREEQSSKRVVIIFILGVLLVISLFRLFGKYYKS